MPTIISPVSPVEHGPVPLALRPEGLAGQRVSILDNSKSNAGPLLKGVRELLVSRYGAVEGVSERKSSSGIPATQSALERLREGSDLVLIASADCGSCTSGCVQDAVALEELGTPSVLLATESFAQLARTLASWAGLSEIQIAATGHPLGGIDADAVQAKCAPLADRVLEYTTLPSLQVAASA